MNYFSSKRLWLAMLLAGILLVAASHAVSNMAKVPSGYKAKVTCSEVFVAGRDANEVIATNFDNISPTFDWVKLDVDENEQAVQGSLFGFGKSRALYREGVGCSLVGKKGLSSVSVPKPNPDSDHEYTLNIKPEVQEAISLLFDDASLPDPIYTRGIVVIQNGQIIAEKYAPEFDMYTRQQSWSTAKGILQALVGIALRDGHLDLADSKLLPEWANDDPRSVITIRDLLQMASGLEFSETYANPNSHVDQMLFNQDDMGAYAARRKLAHPPGTVSTYSSGTTNILSKILRRKLEESSVSYHAFPRQELFDKVSMSTAVFEVDAAGNFVGSSYVYATPRDFARFGQLYLQNGAWKGEQILPENWVEFTRQPAPASDNKYGAHWSLNLQQSTLPELPEDVIHLGGNDGQMIIVIPSKNAVIVRMGVTRPPATLEDDLYPLIIRVFQAI